MLSESRLSTLADGDAIRTRSEPHCVVLLLLTLRMECRDASELSEQDIFELQICMLELSMKDVPSTAIPAVFTLSEVISAKNL